jgi:hypothetical protein
MLKSFSKFTSFKNIKSLARFSTQANYTMDIFPDQIVNNLKAKVAKASEEELKEIEADIVNKINFFDSDQYADTVVLLARANKGSDLLWDVLSRKVFDFHFDYIQSDAILTALNHTFKCRDFMMDPLKKNLYRLYAGKEDRVGKLYRSFYF